MKAFYLSLGALRTTGYGVPDPYFDRCLEGVVLLTAQALVGLFLEAVIGSFFVRLSNPEKRAKTILFSEEAVIQGRTGVSHFIFQVYDMKRHDLVEARVRCCCFYHGQSSEPRCVPMRVPDPDDACDTGLFAGSFLRGLGAILAASVRGCRQTVCDRRTRSAKAVMEFLIHSFSSVFRASFQTRACVRPVAHASQLWNSCVSTLRTGPTGLRWSRHRHDMTYDSLLKLAMWKSWCLSKVWKGQQVPQCSRATPTSYQMTLDGTWSLRGVLLEARGTAL